MIIVSLYNTHNEDIGSKTVAKKDIERALKRKGIRIEELYWSVCVAPEEQFWQWTLQINEEDADRFGLEEFTWFDNTQHALCEIEEWEPID